MVKNAVKWLCKAAFSGMIALLLLHILCLFYYNLPIHFTSGDGATDYVWEKDFRYSNLTEGYGRGKTNNEGYLNPFDYTEDMEIDILVMGSSHMEAFQLAMDQTAVAQLRKLRSEDQVYNLGCSGHDFLVCAGNLAAAVEKYQPRKFVVFETSSAVFSESEVQAILDGTAAELPSYSDGLMGMLQRNKYFCLLYKQLLALPALINPPANPIARQSITTEDFQIDMVPSNSSVKKNANLRILLEQMKNTAASSGARLIIIYHPSLSIQPDTSVKANGSSADVRTLSNLCGETGILFLDMTDRFLEEYENNHVLPHGFFNSSVGNGHLNQYGHAMIAESLCMMMSKVE